MMPEMSLCSADEREETISLFPTLTPMRDEVSPCDIAATDH